MYLQSGRLAISISLLWAVGLFTTGVLLLITPTIFVPILASTAIAAGLVMLIFACAVRLTLWRG